MTRKDYVAIAEVFRKEHESIDSLSDNMVTWCRLRDSIADVFEQDNERFNRYRFCLACEGEE